MSKMRRNMTNAVLFYLSSAAGAFARQKTARRWDSYAMWRAYTIWELLKPVSTMTRRTAQRLWTRRGCINEWHLVSRKPFEDLELGDVSWDRERT